MLPQILILETATKNCSVALIKGEELLFHKDIAEDGFTHAEQLHLFIQEALSSCNIKADELNAIAVAEGPGSYTGLRIGVSAAKGFAFALNIPLIAYSSLTAMAKHFIQHHAPENPVLASIDARRMEAYSILFDRQANEIMPLEAIEFNQDKVNTLAKHSSTIIVLGDAQEKLQNEFPELFIAQANYSHPSAAHAHQSVLHKFRQEEFVDTAYFEPYYFKDFVAGKPKKPQL